MRKLEAMIAAALFVSAVTAGPVVAAPSDPWITTKAKMALLTTENVSATAVNVDTVDGRVTLHGKVETPAEKAKAEEAVRKIDGVKEVRNLLQISPQKKQEAAKASDEAIKERVDAALDADKALAGSSIAVQSVNDGVVLLAGDAKTVSAHLRALETASHVSGVRRVASEIKSPDQLADAEVRRAEKQPAAKDSGDRSVGDATSDMWITSATKLRLLADGDTPALDINVDTRDGVVTLFGIVPSANAKQAAEANAKKVDGVKKVVNELQVVAKPKEDAVKAKDDEIERNVEQAIDSRTDLDDADVKVEVQNGVVRLSGTVPSEQDRLQAAIVARSSPGVRSVLPDALRVDTTAK